MKRVLRFCFKFEEAYVVVIVIVAQVVVVVFVDGGRSDDQLGHEARKCLALFQCYFSL